MDHIEQLRQRNQGAAEDPEVDQEDEPAVEVDDDFMYPTKETIIMTCACLAVLAVLIILIVLLVSLR